MEGSSTMNTLVENELKKIPLKEIDKSPSPYDFRTPNCFYSLTLKKELQNLGQLYPITVEERENGKFTLLDGFRRFRSFTAIQKADYHFSEIHSQVIPAGQLTDLKRFQLLRDKNFYGEKSYGLVAKGRFLKHFYNRGLSMELLSHQTKLSIQEIDDHIDLAEADPIFSALSSRVQLEPIYAAMLWRQYRGWVRGPYQKQARYIARKLLGLSKKEPITMKTWRFYLDFYWKSNSHGVRPLFVKI